MDKHNELANWQGKVYWCEILMGRKYYLPPTLAANISQFTFYKILLGGFGAGFNSPITCSMQRMHVQSIIHYWFFKTIQRLPL